MKISAKTEYACLALIELSLHWPQQNPLPLSVIAQRQKIPLHFLTHILLQLKQLGCVESTRGKEGGYRLSRSPQDIRLSDIIRGFGGFEDQPVKNPGQHRQVLGRIWQEINDVVSTKMDAIHFGMIRDRIDSQRKTLMFEI